MIPLWLKPTLVLLVMLGTMAQGPVEPPERYPGQHSHMHPPSDFFCERHDPAQEHDCHCKRMTGEDDPLCESEPDVRECEVWCWAHAHEVPDGKGGMKWESSHCKCPVICTMKDHTATR